MYEVFALKYGERDTTKCQFFYRESSHDKLTLDYFVWLILGGPQPLLVDTGFRDDDARARGIRNYVSPAAMVERAGVKPGDLPISLITHLPEMLTAFDTIDRLAGSAKLVVAGHDPQVSERFKPVEPGIIKIA